jgi:uncharacterized protein YbbK (DUF523 family)
MPHSKQLDSSTKKAIVSACLLGEFCRYDGKTKKDIDVVEFLKDYEIIPFCPEAPVFGTPRERINVVEIDNKEKIITDITNIDVTAKLQNEIDKFIKENPTADIIILKSKSPSCGLGTTPILDKEKNIIRYGDGLGAKKLKKSYTCKIIDEKNI